MTRTWRDQATLLLCAGLVTAGAACGPEPLGPAHRPPAAPQFDDYSNEASEENCPPNVPEQDCVPFTQAERDQIYWEVLLNIRWDIQQCANIGNKALDWAQYGDLRKYPMMSSYFTGNWTMYTNGAQRIGIRSDQMLTYADRMENILHESTHSYFTAGDPAHSYALYSPLWTEQNCVNW